MQASNSKKLLDSQSYSTSFSFYTLTLNFFTRLVTDRSQSAAASLEVIKKEGMSSWNNN